MRYRLKIDPDTLMEVRSILSREDLLGGRAWLLSDAEIQRRAEILLNSLLGACAAMRVAFRPIAEVLRDSVIGRLAGLTREPGKADVFEMLAERAK